MGTIMRPAEAKVLKVLQEAMALTGKDGSPAMSFGEVAEKSGVKGPRHVASALISLIEKKLVQKVDHPRGYQATKVAEREVFFNEAGSLIVTLESTGERAFDSDTSNMGIITATPSGFPEWLLGEKRFKTLAVRARSLLSEEWTRYREEKDPAGAKAAEKYMDEFHRLAVARQPSFEASAVETKFGALVPDPGMSRLSQKFVRWRLESDKLGEKASEAINRKLRKLRSRYEDFLGVWQKPPATLLILPNSTFLTRVLGFSYDNKGMTREELRNRVIDLASSSVHLSRES